MSQPPIPKKSRKRLFRSPLAIGVIVIALAVFLAWRFVRPMNIFVVADDFERPIDTSNLPASIITLRAGECGACHGEFYTEWKSSIHSQAWTDPYFQADWKFDGAQQICKNCHTPLDRQQEGKVVGFRDAEKWDPILEENPDYDAMLQHEGVTCTGCHLREGEVLGPYGSTDAPHPVRQLTDSNEICLRCHIVDGDRWDTFFRFPPCGTVAEIQSVKNASTLAGNSGEAVATDVSTLGCVECHMPLIERPLVAGGPVRQTRRHWWRGGHDPAMVRQALTILFDEAASDASGRRVFRLQLTNSGAGHYLPTGTPDRHLTVRLRILDQVGRVLKEERAVLKRTVMWRPFIVDLWDTRLPAGASRTFRIDFDSADAAAHAVTVEAQIDYYLVDEKRRIRIGYRNDEPTHHTIYRQRIDLDDRQRG
jgi:hypothetical protein